MFCLCFALVFLSPGTICLFLRRAPLCLFCVITHILAKSSPHIFLLVSVCLFLAILFLCFLLCSACVIIFMSSGYFVLVVRSPCSSFCAISCVSVAALCDARSYCFVIGRLSFARVRFVRAFVSLEIRFVFGVCVWVCACRNSNPSGVSFVSASVHVFCRNGYVRRLVCPCCFSLSFFSIHICFSQFRSFLHLSSQLVSFIVCCWCNSDGRAAFFFCFSFFTSIRFARCL